MVCSPTVRGIRCPHYVKSPKSNKTNDVGFEQNTLGSDGGVGLPAYRKVSEFTVTLEKLHSMHLYDLLLEDTMMDETRKPGGR